jgi:hypothetical protein
MTEVWTTAPLHLLLAEVLAEYAEPRPLMMLRISSDGGKSYLNAGTVTADQGANAELYPVGCVCRLCALTANNLWKRPTAQSAPPDQDVRSNACWEDSAHRS